MPGCTVMSFEGPLGRSEPAKRVKTSAISLSLTQSQALSVWGCSNVKASKQTASKSIVRLFFFLQQKNDNIEKGNRALALLWKSCRGIIATLGTITAVEGWLMGAVTLTLSEAGGCSGLRQFWWGRNQNRIVLDNDIFSQVGKLYCNKSAYVAVQS